MLQSIRTEVRKLVLSLLAEAGVEVDGKRIARARAERRRTLLEERARLQASGPLHSSHARERMQAIEDELAALAPAWRAALVELVSARKRAGWQPEPVKQTDVAPEKLRMAVDGRAKPVDLAPELALWRSRYPLVDVAPILAELCARPRERRFVAYQDEIAARLDAAQRRREREILAARTEAGGRFTDVLRALRELHLEAADDAELVAQARRLALSLPNLEPAAVQEIERICAA